jgi:NAD-dependent dihydropyrimidine dehydrogenase PreA subunit
MYDVSQLVDLDDEGEPDRQRFVFVDEPTCIGCTNCAGVARSTFLMDDE